MAIDDHDFSDAFDGQKKLNTLFQRLENLPLEEEILTIIPSGMAIELRDDHLVARWIYEGKTLKFVEGSSEGSSFETESMDAAFEHTRAFLRGIKSRDAKKPR